MEKAILKEASAIQLKTDVQNVIETRAFQIQYDKHLFSVRRMASLEKFKAESDSSGRTLQQTVEAKHHHSNNSVTTSTTRKSWLFDYKIINWSYPSYKNDLKDYICSRTSKTTDNNDCTVLCIRADRLWEDFELLEENLTFTYLSILELLEVNMDHYRFQGVKKGRNLSIILFCSTNN